MGIDEQNPTRQSIEAMDHMRKAMSDAGVTLISKEALIELQNVPVQEILEACQYAKDVLDHPEQNSLRAWRAIELLEIVIFKLSKLPTT